MRYAKLKEEWLLRGWSDVSRAIINYKTGDCRSLSEQFFYTAKACDGVTDFHSVAVLPNANNLLDKLIAEGMAEECKEGSELYAFQKYRRATAPYVRDIHWSITGRCNLKCRHCYVESPHNRYGELALPDILSLIDQMAAANIHLVQLTGGEPFLRSDLLEIMAALQKKHITISIIYSNGLLITDKVLSDMKALGISPSIQISFDGCGTHDTMRGLEGVERPTIDSIHRLRKHGFKVAVATSIDATNISSLLATYELMKQLDIQFWRISRPQKVGCWRESNTDLSMENMLTSCAAVAARWLADKKPFNLQMPRFVGQRETKQQLERHASIDNTNQNGFSPDDFDCMSCRISPSLLPDGTIIPCPGYADTDICKQMPNLLQESFTNVWTQSKLRSVINIQKGTILAHNNECATCSEFKWCGGGCRANAVATTGNLMSRDPNACEMYRTNYSQRFRERAGL